MIFLRHLAPSTSTEELREIGVEKSKELVNLNNATQDANYETYQIR
jgi:hypothetical protein